jgi:pre-mRNA-processing factor 19
MDQLTAPELTTCAFHPDGTLFALGTATGLITLYRTKTLAFAASFPLPLSSTPSPITSLSFSENGIWISATVGSSIVVFDLRKEGEAAVLKVFDLGSEVRDAVWDYSGQFLASVGAEGVAVMAYRKKEKSWSEVLRAACPGVRVAWGGKAESLVVAGKEGVVSLLGSK